MAQGRVSHAFANKVFSADVQENYPKQPRDLDRRARDVLSPAEIYLEDEPSVLEWAKGHIPTLPQIVQYGISLFPPLGWLFRYNIHWLLGDITAGVTAGMVVVPQALAYAALAQLSPTHGLYTSFAGAAVYWMFGTSKDILLGSSAIASLLVSQVSARVAEAAVPGTYSNEEIAHTLTMLSGAVLLALGLLRLGWVVEFIPTVPISAFTFAASLTIISTQLPAVLGISGVNTRGATFEVLVGSLKGLRHARVDAAIGISTIVLLFSIRNFCAFMEERQPSKRRLWALFSSARVPLITIFFTVISYIVNHQGSIFDSEFRIVGFVRPGLRHAQIPKFDTNLIKLVLPELPPVVIILVIGHVAIAKAMARIHNYTINSSQEIMALGAANLFSPFAGGYILTGSFGSSAVLSKAGGRTPLASFFSAGIILMSLYVFTGAFYYIPNAALGGLIIHCVSGSLRRPKLIFRYWQFSPMEIVIWIASVSFALFYSLDWSIYVGLCLSFGLLLVQMARTKGRFLGLVRVRQKLPGHADGVANTHPINKEDGLRTARLVFLPLDRENAMNPKVRVESPYPGVFIYRFPEGYNYTNQAYHVDYLYKYLIDHTTGLPEEHSRKSSDRLWSDYGPRARKTNNRKDLPRLRAIVLDFSAVNNVDITALQGLVDLRRMLDSHAAPDTVDWHFASVYNRWTRKALALVGFGYPSPHGPESLDEWQPLYSIAPLDAKDDSLLENRKRDSEVGVESKDAAHGDEASVDEKQSSGMIGSVTPADRPFFHLDLHDAVDSAVRSAKAKDSDVRATEE